jgi:hypothetical protein
MASSNDEIHKKQTEKLLNNNNDSNNCVNHKNKNNNIDTINIELHETNSNVVKSRDEWSNKIEYMLSVIGYVVDLGNLKSMHMYFSYLIFNF